MRILVISQYFWPENFRVNDLCLELQDRGHEVSVLTGKPNYPNGEFYDGYTFFNRKSEIWNGINIYRAELIVRKKGTTYNLILNYMSFALSSSIRLLFIKKKFDRIIVYQLSPGTVGLPGLFAKYKFKAPLYFYIQDIWPESLSDAGGLNSKFILNLVNKMMMLFYNHSNIILVQSKGFINFLEKKGVQIDKLKYLPNTVESFYQPEISLNIYSKQMPIGFNIIFAGNIGAAQDFETIIKAALILKNNGHKLNWVIIGDGRAKEDIISSITELNLDNFYFLGSKKTNEMPFYFACSDLLLVSLKKSIIFSLTIPSKVQSYLACKKPIIGNIDGIGASTILDSGGGLVSESGNELELANNVVKFLQMSVEERNIYSKNGYDYFLQNFERTIIYNNLENYLINNNV